MNEMYYFRQLYNHNRQLFYELQKLRRSMYQCHNMIYMMQGHVHRLNMQNYMLQLTIARIHQPMIIENFHLSHDINLDQLKVNSIQSGAALNIGEWICSRTNSDMQMEMGANSHNSGDCNEMRYCDDDILRDKNREQP